MTPLTAAQRARIVRRRGRHPQPSMAEIADAEHTTKQTVSTVLRDHDTQHGTSLSVRDPVASREAHARQTWTQHKAEAAQLPTVTTYQRLVEDLTKLLELRPDGAPSLERINEAAGNRTRGWSHALSDYETGVNRRRGEPVDPRLSTIARVVDAYAKAAGIEVEVRLVIRRKR